MTDTVSKETRSRIMASIRSKNTNPEKKVRRSLWASGKRFRMHDKKVFGTPDVSNRSRRIAIFVDGCFWHGCSRCYRPPKTNSAFWKRKIDRNRKRRLLVRDVLKKERFRVLEFWEHEVIKSPESVIAKIDKVWDRNRSKPT
jgi:DNA mismatch endonuclease (patch repair protein)